MLFVVVHWGEGGVRVKECVVPLLASLLMPFVQVKSVFITRETFLL